MNKTLSTPAPLRYRLKEFFSEGAVKDVSFGLFPFVVLSIVGFLCCIAIPRLKKHAFRVLVGSTAFGLGSLVGLWLAAFLWSEAWPVLGAHLSGSTNDSFFFPLLWLGYLLCGIGGSWLALRISRRPWSTRTITGVFSVTVLMFAIAGANVLACLRRGHALDVRKEMLRREATANLRAGMSQEDVTRFFDQHGMKVEFGFGYASGTIFTSGCAPLLACGDDAALIGLRVPVNSAGTVTSQPEVVSLYTNCL